MSISVALCTYNGEKYLKEQLNSIAGQSLLPDELVVCDDGSTDGTEEIIRNFAGAVPFLVRYSRNERNLGSTRNFENAIGLCEGEFIALSDQDDIWLPDKLEKLSAVLVSDKTIGGVFSDSYLVNGEGEPMSSTLWQQVEYRPRGTSDTVTVETLLRHNVLTGATMLFRSELRSKFSPIPRAWIHDGWMAWMIVLFSRLVPVCERLMKYRLHASQQVGLALNTSIWNRLLRARTAGSAPLLLLASQFEELRDFCATHPETSRKELMDDLARKIRHSLLRGTLPRSRFMRVYPIVRNLRDYRRYSLGALTMAKDLLR